MNSTVQRNDFLSAMDWRYAVKKFDSSAQLSDQEVAQLLEVVRMAPTAYGQQPFKVLNIRDKAVRQKLLSASFGQDKVVNASHLLVFAIDTGLGEESVQQYMELTAATRNISVEAVEGFGNVIKNTYQAFGKEGVEQWAAKQAYLAQGFLLAAAAVMKIDTCPMEGFDPAQYDEILGLKEKGLHATVVVTLGKRAEDDTTQSLAKVRKPMEQMVEVV